MKNSGLQLIIAEANSDLSHKKIAFEEPLALVLGSEGKGVTREIRKLADAALSIPGSGRVESLNVSVAGAILMSEIFKLRQK
jgi:23S rRNA (guanosine2251-2'-O)-methyltransferase